MPRFFYDPTEGSDEQPIEITPIVLGGTGANTADGAAINLGFVKTSSKNQANGVAGLDGNGKILVSTLPTGANGVAILDASGKVSSEQLPSLSGSVETAVKLASSRNIAASGDVIWSVNFDGSANVSAQATLSNSGVIAGSNYTKFTVDAKGRVTSATMLTANDIPVHTHTEYAPVAHTHSTVTLASLEQNGAGNGQVIQWNNGKWAPATMSVTGSIDTATKLAVARSISTTGDATWSVNFDGSSNATGALTLANTGVTAGSGYGKFSVDAKGRITNASVLTAGDIPVHTHTDYATTSHMHTLGQLSQSGAGNGQVPQWNSSANAWIPTTMSVTGSIDTATKLAVARSISTTGDATWSVNFDGSNNATGALTLTTTGVTAGSGYGKFSVDAKGRITNAAMLTAGDIPAHTHTDYAPLVHTHTGITLTSLAQSGAGNGQVPQWNSNTNAWVPATMSLTGSIDTATKLAVARNISATGDATWSLVTKFDGSADVTGTLTLANTAVTAGNDYTKFNVDTKGRITYATKLTAGDLPAHTHADYAPLVHNHTGYATTTHTHTEYALTTHTHTGITLDSLAQSNASKDQVIRWNGTKWEPGTVSVTGSIASADKLTTARSISATGDATWSVTFDGIKNETGTLTLATTGVIAGNGYSKFNVDAKGRITSASALTATDIPIHTHTGYAASTHTHSEFSSSTHTHTLSTLGGTLALSQLAKGGALTDYVIKFNGTDWVPAPLPAASAFNGILDGDLTFNRLGTPSTIKGYSGLFISGNYNQSNKTVKTFEYAGDIINSNSGTAMYREMWKAPSGSGGNTIVGFAMTSNSASLNFTGARSIWYSDYSQGLVVSSSSNPSTQTSIFKIGDDTNITSFSHIPWFSNQFTLGTSTLLWNQIFTANGISTTSDARIKNITGNVEGLSFINKLKPVKYILKAGKVDLVDGDEIERYHEDIDTEKVSDGIQTFIKEIDGKVVEITEEVFTDRPKLVDVNIYDADGNILRVEQHQSVIKTPVYKKKEIPVAGVRTHYGLIAQDVKTAIDELGMDFAGWMLADKDDPDSQQSLRYEEFIAPLIQAVKELSAKVDRLESIITANGLNL